MVSFSAQELLKLGIVFSEIIYPIKKLQDSIYICDKRFALDSVLEMYKAELNIGVALISGHITHLYMVSKTGTFYDIKNIKTIKVDLQKRQKKGGQSAQRIGRIRDEKEDRYIKHIVDSILDSYLDLTIPIIDNIIIAGPSILKNKVIEIPLFAKNFQHLLLKVLETDEIKDNTIHNIITECEYDIENNNSVNKDMANQVNNIKKLISDASDLLVFGEDKVLKKLNSYLLESIYVDYTIYDEFIKLVPDTTIPINRCNLLFETEIPIIGIKYY